MILSLTRVLVNMMPLFHVGGIVRNLLAPILSGGSAMGLTPAAEPSPEARSIPMPPTSTANAAHKQPTQHFYPHGTHAPSEYYFYQALLHYYLSPLDIRILREQFGPFSSFPATILPKVERVIPRVVDDDVRKRTKYLSHSQHSPSPVLQPSLRVPPLNSQIRSSTFRILLRWIW